MKRLAITLAGLALLAHPGAVSAQTLYGPGGLVLHPTADVPARGQFSPSILVLPQRVPPFPGFHTHPTWGSLGLDYGLTDDIEIGLVGLAITDVEPAYGGYAKWRFMRETDRQPAVAIGFAYTGFAELDESGFLGAVSRSGFFALRKKVSGGDRYPVIAHVGGQYINYLGGVKYDRFLPYAGIEVGFSKNWTFIAEARPRTNVPADIQAATALSIAYKYGKGNRLVVTWANTGQGLEPRFGVGAGFTIGTRR